MVVFQVDDINEKVHLDKSQIKNNFNCNYGCRTFELTKI